MSTEPLSLSEDLKKLVDEGYFVQIKGGFLLVRDVPYVNSQRQTKRGTLISSLSMAGNVTMTPDTHVVYFDGEFPCKADGTPISNISKSSSDFILGHGVVAKHDFSSKPEGGYANYYDKMTTYIAILAGPARIIEPDANARTFRTPDEEEDSMFNYIDTASGRVGIGALNDRLASDSVAIIGLGGTGGYILDFVAKTPVAEIRLFDGDEFLQHNAFRAPGAPSIEQLRRADKKVAYFRDIYSKMHNGITAIEQNLTLDNLQLLDGITFAFLSMDSGKLKEAIVAKLETLGASFIDVGMGMSAEDLNLTGQLRVTTSTPENRQVFRSKVPMASQADDDLYATNIQVADLNCLNAVLAVIKWKKLRGFYYDFEQELHSSYTVDGNTLYNEERS